MKKFTKKVLVLFMVVMLVGTSVISADTSNSEESEQINPRQSVVFADERIEKIVRTSLSKADGEPISPVEMESVLFLNIKESGTYDLTGLEHATNLKSLDVNATDKNTTIFNNFNKLAGMPITYINFKTPVATDSYDTFASFSNTLKDLYIQKYIPENELSFISSLSNLSTLTIRGIEPIDFDASVLKDLSSLEILQVDSLNFGGTLDLSNLSKIKQISFRYTDIESLDFISPDAPITYTLFNDNKNLVDASRLGEISTINTLQINNSKLENIDFVKNLPNLKSVYLYGNKISDISGFENHPGTFTILHLGENMIKNPEVINTMKFRYDTIIDYPALVQLNDNGISDISFLKDFEPSATETLLRISGNKITDFSPLAKFESIPSVTISAINQKVSTSEVFLGDLLDLGIVEHNDSTVMQYFSMKDLNKDGYGEFEVVDGKVLWKELTPEDSKDYNKLHVANFDVSQPITARIAYHVIATSNVTKQKYSVSYNDGVAGEVLFEDQVFELLDKGSATPEFVGTPARVGYDFVGWTPDVSEFVESNAIYSALWKIKEYTVTFDSNGGSLVEPQLVNHGDVVVKPSAPTLENAVFAGWYSDKDLTEEYDFTTVVDSDMQLYAKWTNSNVPNVDETPKLPNTGMNTELPLYLIMLGLGISLILTNSLKRKEHTH